MGSNLEALTSINVFVLEGRLKPASTVVVCTGSPALSGIWMGLVALMLTALGVPSGRISYPLQITAEVADHVAALIELEGARTGCRCDQVGPGRRGHEAVALDGEIQRVVGELQRALVELLGRADRATPLPTWVLALTKMELA